MNIKKIREAVNSGFPDELLEMLIIEILAEDKNAITDILQVLNKEREGKKRVN